MVSFSRIKEIWDKWGFEIVLGFCILFILFYAIGRKLAGKRGSWSKYLHLPNLDKKRTRGGAMPSGAMQQKKAGAESKGEIECRRVLEYLFKRPFNKARPDFLRNPVTGGSYNLELDCYNEDLRLAVEYDGQQHFNYIPYFHKTKDAFYNQKYRDYLTDRMCQDNRVTLIRVPYTVKLEEIKGFLEKELHRVGYLRSSN